MAKKSTENEGLKTFLEKTYEKTLSEEKVLEYKSQQVYYHISLVKMHKRSDRKRDILFEIAQNIAISLWSVGLAFVAETNLNTGFLFLTLAFGVLIVFWALSLSRGE